MVEIPDVEVPAGLELLSVERNIAGETNDVYFCRARFEGRATAVYVKAAKRARHFLGNERAVLDALRGSAIPVPRVLWYAETPRAVLVQEALPGRMVWDHIDPRREGYDPEKAPEYLRAYGNCLGAIHALPLPWDSQKRSRLAGLIGEEDVREERFEQIVSWLRKHAPTQGEPVFVHGDLNTASVLFQGGAVSGVVDWEFAGTGWREYDLAWVLRARRTFLKTPAEREAILAGYRERASYDESALRWCEALNTLHFAFWSREEEPSHTDFALGRAMGIAGLD